jgi:hypothetical protein
VSSNTPGWKIIFQNGAAGKIMEINEDFEACHDCLTRRRIPIKSPLTVVKAH